MPTRKKPPSAVQYRPACGDKPCTACPFRRKSLAGWLGAATPTSFIIEISMEHPLPCHPSIDYGDQAWLEKWTKQRIGMICAGSLIMAANMGKRPRDPAFPRLPSDKKIIFGTYQEFLDHHNNASLHSWEL